MVGKLKNRTTLLYTVSFFGVFGFNSCVEIFSFNTEEGQKILVVDGYISNVSFNEIDNRRYFDISLIMTGKVTNVRDEPVVQAEMQITNDLSESWEYTEVRPGLYRLFFEDFKVETNRTYQLHIQLSNGERYESEVLPVPTNHEEAEVIWEETTKLDYIVVAGATEIGEVQGIQFKAKMPTFESDITVYNKWDFLATYQFTAPLANPQSANRECWINDQFFFDDVVIEKEKSGELIHDLFFLNTKTKLVVDGLSVLIRQQSMTELNYQFWSDLKNQEMQSELFAPPPYNLISNIYPVGHEGQVVGYFGVVTESFLRWVFDPLELSYSVQPSVSLAPECRFPVPECLDCLEAPIPPKATITNIKPSWWIGW